MENVMKQTSAVAASSASGTAKDGMGGLSGIGAMTPREIPLHGSPGAQAKPTLPKHIVFPSASGEDGQAALPIHRRTPNLPSALPAPASNRAVQPQSKTTGPPVYRPQPVLNTAQPKTGGGPAVYRPSQFPQSLARNLGGRGAGARTPGLIGPPVYKPQQTPVTAQPKMGGAPPVYRPASAGAERIQGKGLGLQTKPAGSKAENRAQQSPTYLVQAPMLQGRDLQEIRVGMPGAAGTIGSVRMRPAEGDKLFISDLQVSPEHRRHGVASQLVRAALRSAAIQGKSGALLEANPGAESISPQALVSMYQKLGFRQTGLSHHGKPLMEFGAITIPTWNRGGIQARLMPTHQAPPPKSSAGRDAAVSPIRNAGPIQPLAYNPHDARSLGNHSISQPIFTWFHKPVMGAIQRASINVGDATKKAAEILGIDATPTDKPHTTGGTGRGQGGAESHQARDARSVARVNEDVQEGIRKSTGGANLSAAAFVRMTARDAKHQAQRREQEEQEEIKHSGMALEQVSRDERLYSYILLNMDLSTLKRTYERALVVEFRANTLPMKKIPKQYKGTESDPELMDAAVEWLISKSK